MLCFAVEIEVYLIYLLLLLYAGIEKVAESMKDSIPKVEWDYEGIHYFDNGPLTVQFLFVLDALNFCFWPGPYMFLEFCFVEY